MSKTVRKRATVFTAMLLCFAGASTYLVIHTRSAVTDLGSSTPKAVSEIGGYRTWQKVNHDPELMDPGTRALCAPISPIGAAVLSPPNPHQDKYITVYVNDTGKNAMMEQAKPKFPAGSVIVKEKLPDKSSQSPELLTVMIKKEKGFNPQSGDWEYMVVDGKGESISARGKLQNCQGCHLGNPNTDYIFRTYLPAEVANKLK